ncbi:serine/threonine-protein kinase [Leptotrichia hongkongensis]|uniref:serine/threonine-protein kinase n=1 Tax=Leptotrichia hongkongensis TaxID=554406 RepID=UPI0035A83B29
MDFLSKGTILNGKYKILNYVAKSDFSNIYMCEDRQEEKVIIKECYSSEIVMRNGKEVFTEKYKKDFENLKGCFWKEKCILEKFLKKSKRRKRKFVDDVVKFVDFFSENGTNYIVTEYFRGVTLKKYILENRIKNGKMRINHILEIFFKIAEVVCKIHKKGIIHCDLKPSNILIDIRGNIRIIDFGASLKKKEKVEFVKVSDGYSPIEIYSEKVEIDERTDVYSLAALLYFMLCSVKVDGAIKRFYKAELEFDREVILGFEKIEKFKEVEEVIKKGLEFDRQKRFGSVREMIEKLRKIFA